eukprot:jgi/Bigna1/126138/aug1.2_g846
MHGKHSIPKRLLLTPDGHSEPNTSEATLEAAFIAPEFEERYTRLFGELDDAEDAKGGGGDGGKGCGRITMIRIDEESVEKYLAEYLPHREECEKAWGEEAKQWGGEKPRIILYTSGSTGRPKGAVMTDKTLKKELSVSHYGVNWNGSEVGIYDSPHAVSSSLYNMMAYLINGGRCSVFRDLSETFDICEVTGPSSLGRRYQARLNAGEKKEQLDKQFKKILGWRVTYLNCGGATPIPAVQKWLKETYPHCKITENYAATECGGITNSGDGDVGKIKEGIEVRLVDWAEYKTTDKPYV